MRSAVFYSGSGAASASRGPAGSVELRLEAGGRDAGLRSEAYLPNSPWVAARPWSVSLWTGEASYSRSSPSRRLLIFARTFIIKNTVLAMFDTVLTPFLLPFHYRSHYRFSEQRKRNVDFFDSCK